MWSPAACLASPRGCSSIMRWFCHSLQLWMRTWILGRCDDLLRPLCWGEGGLGSLRDCLQLNLEPLPLTHFPHLFQFLRIRRLHCTPLCCVFTPPSSLLFLDFFPIYSGPLICGTNTSTSHRFFMTDVGGVAVSLDAPEALGIRTVDIMVLCIPSVCSGDTFQSSQWTPETG